MEASEISNNLKMEYAIDILKYRLHKLDRQYSTYVTNGICKAQGTAAMDNRKWANSIEKAISYMESGATHDQVNDSTVKLRTMPFDSADQFMEAKNDYIKIFGVENYTVEKFNKWMNE